MQINKVEDLIVWKRSIQLCKLVYEITANFPSGEKFNIVKHMHECARNVPGNIAEGFGRYHYQESSQFYRIARGSVNELKSDLLLSQQLGFGDKNKILGALNMIEEIIKMLNSIILSSKLHKIA